MHGRGAWRDNVFVERIWRTVKYERVYLRADDTVHEAKEDMAHCVALGLAICFYVCEKLPLVHLEGQVKDKTHFRRLVSVPTWGYLLDSVVF